MDEVEKWLNLKIFLYLVHKQNTPNVLRCIINNVRFQTCDAHRVKNFQKEKIQNYFCLKSLLEPQPNARLEWQSVERISPYERFEIPLELYSDLGPHQTAHNHRYKSPKYARFFASTCIHDSLGNR